VDSVWFRIDREREVFVYDEYVCSSSDELDSNLVFFFDFFLDLDFDGLAAVAIGGLCGDGEYEEAVVFISVLDDEVNKPKGSMVTL